MAQIISNSKKHKIAIVGAGIFGCEIATQLSKYFSVTLFEKNANILQGATLNNQNRLHLGFHYPRDLDTAIQSKNGFYNFIKKYSDAVNLDFTNWYAIHKNSQTSTKEFISFCRKLNLEINQITLNEAQSFGVRTEKLESVWRCGEGVFDIDVLRQIFIENLKNCNVEMFLDCNVNSINRESKKFAIHTNQRSLTDFDFVVISTYRQDRIKIDKFEHYVDSIFQTTLIVEAALEKNQFGLTVIDGDFFTLLPKGFSQNSYLYAPKLSVLEETIGKFNPGISDNLDRTIDERQYAIVKRFHDYFDDNFLIRVVTNLITKRTLDLKFNSQSRRTSYVVESIPNLFHIHSGKVVHSLQVGEIILELIGNKV